MNSQIGANSVRDCMRQDEMVSASQLYHNNDERHTCGMRNLVSVPNDLEIL